MRQQNVNGVDINKLEDCVMYFRARSVYKQLFGKMREKYISLGHFGGTVHLYGLNQEEFQQLSGFFRKDFEGKGDVVISAVAMENALANSKFAGLKWEDILQSYFQETFIGKKQQKQKEVLERECFFRKLLESIPVGAGRVWLEMVLETQGEGYFLLMKQYRENADALRVSLTLFLKAIPCLPYLLAKGEELSYKLLPVFAAETTGNPHFFDAGTVGEQLLICFLKSNIAADEENLLTTAEEKARLLYEAGLLKDDLSNNTLAYGLKGLDSLGQIHEGIEGFRMRKEPMVLTLKTISRLKQIRAQAGKLVYIVENPAIFSKLVELWPDATILCGNGQIRLATFVLLDLFETETKFFYAGDFDPEGLMIAQKLKERYGERVHLWKYNRDFYEIYQSEVEISEKSLKKLGKIYMEELQEIKEAMRRQKRATYQEAMLIEYLR